MIKEQTIKLTSYSHGAGCGCKISPKVLDEILKESGERRKYEALLIGNEHRDDAAVYSIEGDQALISTTDFFMPIVDDPKTFGKIASTNAISDVYAMGGKPLMAIAILGWPINDIPVQYANEVIEGGREACAAANIPLAGGHSIDSPEPIFGLAVTGIVNKKHLKSNGGAQEGDIMYITKKIGVGILSTAQKKGLLKDEHAHLAADSMLLLNDIGQKVAALEYVHAITDVTGFGVLGHLSEMCEASGVGAQIDLKQVPLLDDDAISYYLDNGAYPGGTKRNWDSYGHKIGELQERAKLILADPQTSGGLLMSIAADQQDAFESFCDQENQAYWKIGQFTKQGNVLIQVVQS